MSSDSRAHWDSVYADKAPEKVSWRQARPERSLALIAAHAGKTDPIIDIGAGAATLVDALLADGYSDITALDIAEQGLAHLKARLGAQAGRVDWQVADITRWRPPRRYTLWHDRAVLHFLTAPADQRAYAATLQAALRPGGAAIISGFAPGGPSQCSGLPIVQHDAHSLATLLGAQFSLLHAEQEEHLTPGGASQLFRYHVFRRR